MHAVLHSERAQLEQAVRQVAHRRGEAQQHAIAYQRVVAQQLAEHGRAHGGDERIVYGDDIGRARQPVDRGVLAEPFAGAHFPVRDLAARGGIGGGPHVARHDHVNVIVGGFARDDSLAGGYAPPAALARELLQRGKRNAFEKPDVLQAQSGRLKRCPRCHRRVRISRSRAATAGRHQARTVPVRRLRPVYYKRNLLRHLSGQRRRANRVRSRTSSGGGSV